VNEPSGAGAIRPFETAVDRLEEIVSRIEDDELELDEALELFEEGVRLLREAQAMLGAAEERVQQLIEDTSGLRLEDFRGSR
jgi:exodeoxyribonuclease VII small subunit